MKYKIITLILMSISAISLSAKNIYMVDTKSCQVYFEENNKKEVFVKGYCQTRTIKEIDRVYNRSLKVMKREKAIDISKTIKSKRAISVTYRGKKSIAFKVLDMVEYPSISALVNLPLNLAITIANKKYLYHGFISKYETSEYGLRENENYVVVGNWDEKLYKKQIYIINSLIKSKPKLTQISNHFTYSILVFKALQKTKKGKLDYFDIYDENKLMKLTFAPKSYEETIVNFENAKTNKNENLLLHISNTQKFRNLFNKQERQKIDKLLKKYIPTNTINNDAKPLKSIKHNGLEYKEIISPYSGKIWLDRNIGANRVCLALDDEKCYGDYFQWGRDADGHEKSSNTSVTSKLSISDAPKHSKYIKAKKEPYNWIDPQNNKLWQKNSLKNNPCPSAFRVPTIYELMHETVNTEAKNNKDVFKSFLKLPSAGNHNGTSVSIQGAVGKVWSSSTSGMHAQYIYFDDDEVVEGVDWREEGYSVRCIKN